MFVLMMVDTRSEQLRVVRITNYVPQPAQVLPLVLSATLAHSPRNTQQKARKADKPLTASTSPPRSLEMSLATMLPNNSAG